MDTIFDVQYDPYAGKGRVLVFDSGVGGLTIAEELRTLGPQLDLHYAADSGFFPYGDKSDDELRKRLPKVAKVLCEKVKPDVFVIACNTASTLALQEVRDCLDIAVVGTVPAIKPAASLTQTGVIGLLATPGTIRRSYTADLIDAFARRHTVIPHGSIDLVQLAEIHAAGGHVPLSAFAEVQRPLFEAEKGHQMDTIVLACTHFPLVRSQLIASAPRPVSYIDSGAAIARQTIRVLPAQVASSEIGGRAILTSEQKENSQLEHVLRRFGFPIIEAVQVPD